MRTPKIFFLNNFHIEHTAVLVICIMLYIIFLVLTYLITMEVYTF